MKIIESEARNEISYDKIELLIPPGAYTFATPHNQKIRHETKKEYEYLTGIWLTSNNLTQIINNNFVDGIYIDNKEFFPADFDVKFLTSGIEIKPNDRFYELFVKAQGSPIEIRYKVTGTVTVAYRVYFVLRYQGLLIK
ncbi:MAG: hypothetical protein QXS90_00370 [Candidatus Diapherotrites archaeon]